MSAINIRPIPPNTVPPKRPSLQAIVDHTGITPNEKRARMLLDKAISAVSRCKMGNELYNAADRKPFVQLVEATFYGLLDMGEDQ